MSRAVKPGPGRGHTFQPTDTQRVLVKQLAAFGIPQRAICSLVGTMAKANPLDPATLRKHFAHELDMGLSEAITKVAGLLLKSAIEGNVTAQIFFLKTRGGWRETNRLEVSDQDGNPLPVAAVPLDAAMLDAAYARALEKYGVKP